MIIEFAAEAALWIAVVKEPCLCSYVLLHISRGVPDLDLAGYLVDFVDPVRIWIRPDLPS